MTQRISIAENNIEFSILEGDLHEVNTEDGVGYYPISWVAFSYCGKIFQYPTHFLAKMKFIHEVGETLLVCSRRQCNDFIAEIMKHGSINLSKWTEIDPSEPKESLEQRWADDYHIERQGH